MTDKQRLAKLLKAEELLKQTTRGYTPNGVHWRKAMALIDEVEESLRADQAPPIPNLGPVTKGGKSLLLFSLTHKTDKLPLYPAADTGWVAGLEVLAPEKLAVTKQSSAQGADAFYARGDSGLDYWFGHIAQAPPNGSIFAKGAVVGKIARLTKAQGGPHLHMAVNAEALLGKGEQLLYGRTGFGPDYTVGAPAIGAQLRQWAAD